MKRIMFIAMIIALSGCSYKFSGASIPDEMKTINIQYFENNSSFVDPNLSQLFTEDFKTRIRTQSKLNIIQSDAQGKFEGNITDYTIVPIAFQDNTKPVAGANRLTITIFVKYTNNIEKKQNFEQSFSAFKDFSLAGKTLQSQQQSLNKEVVTQLTEDIFNRAFAQW